MKNNISLVDRVKGALYGMFIGDALSMPVHWYYDTDALQRDYGLVSEFLTPRNPHPDSILWRSQYSPPNKKADILHEQAKYWGIRDVHYHQFLLAGENTLNLQLVRELLHLIKDRGAYSKTRWLELLVTFMTTPGKHNDTYVEEYLRDFFINYASGEPLLSCGRKDEKHIGGFAHMLPVLLVHAKDASVAEQICLEHLSLTHGGETMRRWGQLLARIIVCLLYGETIVESCSRAVEECKIPLDIDQLQGLSSYSDKVVVGRHFSSACYVDHAVPATLYLALKYRDQAEEALIQNSMCGGDNGGRGVVLGAILGALHGIDVWPDKWKNGLLTPPPFVLLGE